VVPERAQTAAQALLFYPGCVVNLTIRFDETLQVNTVPEAAEGAPEGYDSTLAGRPELVRGRAETGSGEDVADVRSVKEPTIRFYQPLVFPGDDQLTQVCGRIPVDGKWELPGTRKGGTFELTFDYRDLPLDPRVVRGIAVDIHSATVTPEDFGAGMVGGLDERGQLRSVLRAVKEKGGVNQAAAVANSSNLLMTGTVNQIQVTHGKSGSQVMLQGQDTIGSVLGTTKAPLGRLAALLDLSKPIDVVVAALLDDMKSDTGLDIDVSVDLSEWGGGPLPAPADKDGLTRVRQDAKGGGGKTTPGTASKTTYWDLITQYCFLVGAVPMMTGGQVLTIRRARSIYELAGPPKEGHPEGKTPFAGAVPRDIGGRAQRVRLLVYGRDIEELKFERKLTGPANAPTIEVVSLDDTQRGSGKLLIAQWPPEDSKAGSLKASSEKMRIPIPGVRDVAKLTSLAHDLYEEIARGELGGAATTKDLCSLGGDNADPDMVRLRPGDAVEFLTDARALASRSPLVSELNQHEQRSFEDEVAFVTKRLGDPVLARVLVAQTRGAIHGLLNYFLVNAVRYTWSVKSGISVDFDFVNYTVPRHGDSLRSATPTADPKTTKIKNKGENKKRPQKVQSVLGGSRRPLTGFATSPVNQSALKARQERYRAALRQQGIAEDQIEWFIDKFIANWVDDAPTPASNPGAITFGQSRIN